MAAPYTWIWPGQPGGYAPVIAAELAADTGVQARAKQAAGEQAVEPRKPPKPRREARSLYGISARADESVMAYQERGKQIEAKAAARAKKTPTRGPKPHWG